jgi:hypothetical protein
MQPAFHGVGQEARNQIRQIVEVVVHAGVESISNAREI